MKLRKASPFIRKLLAGVLTLSMITAMSVAAADVASTDVTANEAAATNAAAEATDAEKKEETKEEVKEEAKEETKEETKEEVKEEAKEETQEESAFEFKDWTEGAQSLKALTEYVEAVTNKDSGDFIPEEDRIAVFDFDGTLYGELAPNYFEYMMLYHRIIEDDSFTPTQSQLAVATEIADNTVNGTSYDHLPVSHAKAAAEAYSGMTLAQFDAYVKEYAKTAVDGFDNVTYAEFYYQPMVEVVEYLQKNDFKVYIVSGSDRFLCRSITDGVLDIPDNCVIGMDVSLVATNQEYVDGLDYVYSMEDQLVRGDELLVKNLKMNKVTAIAREIGKQPVLGFGNSSGDVSMLNYVLNNNPYRSASFMLVADDGERDYANVEKTAPLAEKWAGCGYNVISMKNDFATIYKEDAVKNPEKQKIFDEYKKEEADGAA